MQAAERQLVSVGGRRPIIAVAAVIAIPAIIVVSTVVTVFAIIAMVIVGHSAPFAVATIDHFKIGATAAIDPDALSVVAPCAVVDAVSLAALADNKNAITRIDTTAMALHVVRRAIEQRRSAILPVSRDPKVGATATVHPNSPGPVAPRATHNAAGFAPLAGQAHAEARVGGTPVEVHVVGCAVDVVFLPKTFKFRAADLKIRSTSSVNPDAAVVIPPRPVEDALRLAALFDQFSATMGIDRAPMPLHVVGRAGDRHTLRQWRGANCGGCRPDPGDKGQGAEDQARTDKCQWHPSRKFHGGTLRFMTWPKTPRIPAADPALCSKVNGEAVAAPR